MPNLEALRTVQYVTDSSGQRTGVLLGIRAWESLVRWIEDATDARIAATALTELQAAGGTEKAGWLQWENVRDRWDDDEETG